MPATHFDAQVQRRPTAVTVKYRDPIPSFVSKSGVWAFAERQRERAGLVNGFDLADVIHKNSGSVEYIDVFDYDQTDAIVVEYDGSFRIRLSSQTSALRDNFTIAHELGHRLLHWPKVKQMYPGDGMKATRWVDPNDKEQQRCEWEANWFASAFLMPAEQFREVHSTGLAAETFGVTQAAVDVRAKTLGIDL